MYVIKKAFKNIKNNNNNNISLLFWSSIICFP